MAESHPDSSTSDNVVWHSGAVDRSSREKQLGQRAGTVWFTGLSGSGKSTEAVEVERLLAAQGRLCYRLDGDGNPSECFTYPLKDSNRVVEEYMLLANFLVAQHLILWCAMYSRSSEMLK